MYSGSRLKADLAHGYLFGGRRTAIGIKAQSRHSERAEEFRPA